MSCVSFLLSLGGSDAFQPNRFAATTPTRTSVAMRSSRPDLNEFDFILGEGNSQSSDYAQQTIVRSRRKIQLPDGRADERATVLASSTFAAPGMTEDVTEEEDADPYADLLEESPVLQKYQQEDVGFGESVTNKLQSMDMQEIISTLIVPTIFAGAGLKWGITKVSGKVSDKVTATLDSFAKEMVYHDGDFEEMKLCYKDYSKKLVLLGPKKSTIMIKSYLKLYSKQKLVSPKSIRLVWLIFVHISI
jgi:hypothetical protein